MAPSGVVMVGVVVVAVVVGIAVVVIVVVVVVTRSVHMLLVQPVEKEVEL